MVSVRSRHAGASPATWDAAPTPDQGQALITRWCVAIGRADDVDALLAYLEHKGVRSIERYTRGWSQHDLEQHLDAAVALHDLTARRRGDLIRVRGTLRHPWRTSTAQPMGGAVG